MKHILLFAIVLLSTWQSITWSKFVSDSDKDRTFASLVDSRGFRLQAYSIKTTDGYILTLHRVVPKGDYSLREYSKNRKPVLVSHGLQEAGADFFINSPQLKAYYPSGTCGDTFGFCLVQTGRYDIWLSNFRGNQYSTDHESLKPRKVSGKRFWRFSFEQMALYDLPAAIGFIQGQTGHWQIGYIGHSQGCAAMFALLSLKPEYSSIINPFISWAPAVYIGHMTSVVKFAIPFIPLLHALGAHFLVSTRLQTIIINSVCSCVPIGSFVCPLAWQAQFGWTKSLNTTRLPVYTSFFPSPTSIRDFAHLGQLYLRDDFVRYNYGSLKVNKQMYGNYKPPRYPLERMRPSTAFAIMYGNTDALIRPENARRLVQELRSYGLTVIDYIVPREKWNHMDFILGKDAGELVYDPTIAILDRYMWTIEKI